MHLVLENGPGSVSPLTRSDTFPEHGKSKPLRCLRAQTLSSLESVSMELESCRAPWSICSGPPRLPRVRIHTRHRSGSAVDRLQRTSISYRFSFFGCHMYEDSPHEIDHSRQICSLTGRRVLSNEQDDDFLHRHLHRKTTRCIFPLEGKPPEPVGSCCTVFHGIYQSQVETYVVRTVVPGHSSYFSSHSQSGSGILLQAVWRPRSLSVWESEEHYGARRYSHTKHSRSFMVHNGDAPITQRPQSEAPQNPGAESSAGARMARIHGPRAREQ